MTKAFVACIFSTLLIAAIARAQSPQDVIRLYETTPGTCNMFDIQPGTHTVTVYHTLGYGLAVRFRVEAGPGVTMVYTGETHHFPNTLGNSQTGVQVCYGACLAPHHDFPLITINYISFGTSSSCANFKVVPHPDAEAIEVMSCDGTPKSVWGGVIFINPSAFCDDCVGTATRFPGVPASFSCAPLPVEASSWGAIKALYR